MPRMLIIIMISTKFRVMLTKLFRKEKREASTCLLCMMPVINLSIRRTIQRPIRKTTIAASNLVPNVTEISDNLLTSACQSNEVG